MIANHVSLKVNNVNVFIIIPMGFISWEVTIKTDWTSRSY